MNSDKQVYDAVLKGLCGKSEMGVVQRAYCNLSAAMWDNLEAGVTTVLSAIGIAGILVTSPIWGALWLLGYLTKNTGDTNDP
jgi:hypothetical protein